MVVELGAYGSFMLLSAQNMIPLLWSQAYGAGCRPFGMKRA